MCYYPQITKDTQQDGLLVKAPSKKADKAVIYKIAILARKLSFQSIQITRLLSWSLDYQIAYTTLLKAYKLECYQYDLEYLGRLINYISAYFSKVVTSEMVLAPKLITKPMLLSSSQYRLL